MAVAGIIGKKGELYPPKNIRKRLGLVPGMEVIFTIEDSELIVEPIPSVAQAITLPKFAKTTTKEFDEFRKKFGKKIIDEFDEKTK